VGDEGFQMADERNDRLRDEWQKLIPALIHEFRNPLVGIRSFIELFDQRYDDPEFRERMKEITTRDLRRIEYVCERLSILAESRPGGAGTASLEEVDVADLLESLLAASLEEIKQLRLVVLKELDRSANPIRIDRKILEQAFHGLFRIVLRWVRDRGDIYVASRFDPAPPDGGGPTLRCLIRFQVADKGRDGLPADGIPDHGGYDLWEARFLLESVGGKVEFDTTTGPEECIIAVDLRA
jgi:signal transduction histidine kinase